MHGQPGASARRRNRHEHQHAQLPQPLGKNTNVFLGSAELAAVCSKLGRIPTREEYLADIGVLKKDADNIYRYMNFNEMPAFNAQADSVDI